MRNEITVQRNFLAGFNRNKKKKSGPASSSNASTLSSDYIESLMEKLKGQTNRKSTTKNYMSVWREFNHFLIRLDRKPEFWEDRVVLFCTYLVDKGRQSSTIRSYISAIKSILKTDGYQWNEARVQLTALINACKIVNDTVKTRFPISYRLLELILFEVDSIYPLQPYLSKLYKAVFALAYYGLMRIGKLVFGEHQMLARNVHVATNKKKILIILFSSKTHSKANKPQRITILGSKDISFQSKYNLNFCPFGLVAQYCVARSGFESEKEPFFMFQDGSDVMPSHVRITLRKILKRLGLDDRLYDTYSFRIGHGVDMFKNSVPVSEIRLAGQWHSNIVYKYITE